MVDEVTDCVEIQLKVLAVCAPPDQDEKKVSFGNIFWPLNATFIYSNYVLSPMNLLVLIVFHIHTLVLAEIFCFLLMWYLQFEFSNTVTNTSFY